MSLEINTSIGPMQKKQLFILVSYDNSHVCSVLMFAGAKFVKWLF
jgi:hypothetical protein